MSFSAWQSYLQMGFSSVAQLCLPLWPHGLLYARLSCSSQSTRACSNSRPSNRWCHPTISSSVVPFSFCLPFFFQHQGLFQWVNSLHHVAKILELQLQHQFFQWILGLISFRTDWFNLLAVQGTLKSLLQHRSSKASILCCSALFMVQRSHLCLTSGKITALTIWTFAGKVMSLLFNSLSRFVRAFLPRSKPLFTMLYNTLDLYYV